MRGVGILRPEPNHIKPPAPEPNGPLREIAGRIKKLSYRDMNTLADAIFRAIPAPEDGLNVPDLVEALLAAADKLETA